jgi:hypothetical protein
MDRQSVSNIPFMVEIGSQSDALSHVLFGSVAGRCGGVGASFLVEEFK